MELKDFEIPPLYSVTLKDPVVDFNTLDIWCAANCDAWYQIEHLAFDWRVFFVNEADATIFALRWV